MLPEAPDPHPGIVFLHGSGPAVRDGARQYAEMFAELGFASLFFDKRGSGSSGGSWLTASLDDLTEDALAAIRFMQERPEVDPRRIGFWGVSQAGWVATLAGSRSQNIGFMILISGGGASPRESELFSYGQAFEREGLDGDARSEGFRAIEAYFQYLTTGQGRAELLATLEAARESPWYPLARLDEILPDETNRANWSWVATWDPAPHIARITCPVLLVFGERDRSHPTTMAVQRWREGLVKAGNDAVTVAVFPGAGHGIRMRDGHAGPGRAPFADGYLDVMVGWLWRHIVVAN